MTCTDATRRSSPMAEAAPPPSRRASLRSPPARIPGDVLRDRVSRRIERWAEADVMSDELTHRRIDVIVAHRSRHPAVGYAPVRVHANADADPAVTDPRCREPAVFAIWDARDLARGCEAREIAIASA